MLLGTGLLLHRLAVRGGRTVTSRAVWVCPECDARLTSIADEQPAAREALQQVIRTHLDRAHDGGQGLTNAAAQAGGWLAPAGHLVELWGGPDDGATVWVPPGELPPVIGVHVTDDGTVVPVRSATARLMADVRTYRVGSAEAAAAAGRPVRYQYDGRPR